MKRIFASLLLILSCMNIALASEVRLSVGESVEIRANETTRVTCESRPAPAPVECNAIDTEIATLYRGCKTKDSKINCFEKYWSSFKKDYPACSIAVCVATCFDSYGVDQPYCIGRCSN